MLVKQVREGSVQLEELMLGKQVDAWPEGRPPVFLVPAREPDREPGFYPCLLNG